MKVYKETVRKYYKYTSETVAYTSPIFNSAEEALAGNGNIRMIEGSDYFGITKQELALFNTGKQITFEILEQNPNDVYGISNITFKNYVNTFDYPAFAIKDVKGSVDGKTWVTITSFKGDASGDATTTNNLNVTTPNYYKFLRFTTTNTDSRYGYGSGGHFAITFLKRKYVESTSSDYDFYEDVDVYKLPKINEKYYGIGG